MWEFLGDHFGELAAILAVIVSAYTAWSKSKQAKEAEQNEESRITKEFGDSVVNLIQPLNERIDQLVTMQDEYLVSICGAIDVLRECRNKLDDAVTSLESYQLQEVKGTRAILSELESQVK